MGENVLVDTKVSGFIPWIFKNPGDFVFLQKSDPANGKVLYPLAPIFACGIQSRFFPVQKAETAIPMVMTMIILKKSRVPAAYSTETQHSPFI